MDKFAGMQAFARVVESGSFAAAARQMGLTRSAVNKLVVNLEAALGAQLLQRTTRRVSPTALGQAYYDRCSNILADVEAAELAVAQLQAEPKGLLRANAPMSFGMLHLAPALAEFMGRYPALQVELQLSDRFVDPIAEGFDLTLRIARESGSGPLAVRQLAPIERVLCAAPAYLQQAGTPEQPQDLRDCHCLQYGYGAGGDRWQLSGPDGESVAVSIQPRLWANNGEVLREAALQGLGVTLLPTFIVGDCLQDGRLQVVLPDYRPPEIAAYALYPPNRYLAAKVRLLVDFLAARFARPAWAIAADSDRRTST